MLKIWKKSTVIIRAQNRECAVCTAQLPLDDEQQTNHTVT